MNNELVKHRNWIKTLVFIYLEDNYLDLDLTIQSYQWVLQKSPMQLAHYLSK